MQFATVDLNNPTNKNLKRIDPLTHNNSAYERGMSRAVHQCELQTVVLPLPAGLFQVHR